MNKGRIEQVGSPQEVFDHPANTFVMDFLGNVNVFHGRVQAGFAHLGSLALDYPEYPHDQSSPAVVYMRPHELDIERLSNGRPHLAAEIVRIQAAGAVARIGLQTAGDNLAIQVDLSASRFAELGLKNGEKVFIAPKRVRVFVDRSPEYVI